MRRHRRERSEHAIRHLLRAPAPAPVGRGQRAAACSRTRSTRSSWPTGSASTTPGRSSTTSSRSTRTPRRPRSSSPPRSQRTKRIRLGHGIVLMPPGYNHPARVAERIATLDLVSNGRVEWGTGESASRAELEGFGIDPGRAAGDVARDRRAGREHAGDGSLPRLPGQVLLDAGAQRRAQAGAEAAPAALGGLLEPRDHPPGRAARHRRAHLRLHRPRRGAALGRRLLRDLQARVRADRPRGQPEHRHGHRLLLPRRRARRRGGAAPTASASSSSRSATTTSSASTSPGRTDIWDKFEAVRDAARTWSVLGGGTGGIGTPDELRGAPARVRGRRASTRPSSSSRAARTATSTSASRSSCSRPR